MHISVQTTFLDATCITMELHVAKQDGIAASQKSAETGSSIAFAPGKL